MLHTSSPQVDPSPTTGFNHSLAPVNRWSSGRANGAHLSAAAEGVIAALNFETGREVQPSSVGLRQAEETLFRQEPTLASRSPKAGAHVSLSSGSWGTSRMPFPCGMGGPGHLAANQTYCTVSCGHSFPPLVAILSCSQPSADTMYLSSSDPGVLWNVQEAHVPTGNGKPSAANSDGWQWRK